MPLRADRVRFGPFELDVRSGELRQDGVMVRLQAQPFRVLVALLEQPGEVVTREALRQRLWPADTFVDFERSLNAAVKRLRESLGDSADDPHYIETLPRHGYRLVARVEPLTAGGSKDPDPAATATGHQAAALSGSRRRAWLVGGAAGAALVAAGATAAFWWWPWRALTPAASALDPQKVVVAVFVNRTGDASLDSLGVQISEWLTQSLARIGGRVAVNPELPSPGGRGLPRSVLAADVDPVRALANRTGAALVVSGAYYLDGDRIRVQSQMIDAATGDIAVALDPSAGPRSTPSEVVADVARNVMGAMAVRQNPSTEPGVGAAIRPPAYDAYVEWELGSASMDGAEAERHWRRSMELDPGFVMPRLSLAFRLQSGVQRRYEDADEVLRSLEAPGLYARATPYEQLLVRQARGILDGNWVVQSEASIEAARLVPTPWSLYRLGDVERRNRRPRAALDALSRIRPEDSPAESGPAASRHLNLRAQLYHELGQYDDELDAARLGQQRYPADGWFFTREIAALVGLGRLADIEAVITRSGQATMRTGNAFSPMHITSHVGAVLLDASRELDAHGDAEAARTMAVRAAAWYRNQVALQKAPAETRGQYADALIHAGDCEGLAVRRDLLRGAPDGLFEQSNYATALVVCGGSRDEARRIAETLARLDRPFLRGLHLYCSARVLATLGDGEAAVRALEASHSRGWGFDMPELHLNYAWKPIRTFPPFLEWLKPRG